MKRFYFILLLLLSLTIGHPAFSQDTFDGVTLISPVGSSDAYLLEMDETTVMTWTCANSPAFTPYLLTDGSLLRPSQVDVNYFGGGGAGGRIQRFDSAGHLVWDYYYSSYDAQQHHDIQPMPNGNVLLIAWERKTHQEALDVGRINLADEIWPTHIVEIEPTGVSGGTVVWEWHIWDHLIQDVSASYPNYGVVADHPELMDINSSTSDQADWIHANAIDYNETLDQIVFCSRPINEIYVIDHSTTTLEAAGHTGGNSGMGGDFLYRWGNPQVYDRGDDTDQIFFVVHGVNWVDEGYPGAGNLLAFNNGDRPGSTDDYATVVEIVPPLNASNLYDISPGRHFGPIEPVWTHGGPGGYYGGPTQCGAFRLPNGNTLITLTFLKTILEVDAEGQTEWSHVTSLRVGRASRYAYTPTPTPVPSQTPTPVCLHDGDTNMSGNISAGDAQMAFEIALEIISPMLEEACAADCNGDDFVTAGDAQSIFFAALSIGSCLDPL